MPIEHRPPTAADLTAAALFEAACQAEQDRAAGLLPNAEAALWILDGTTFRPMTPAEEAELAEVLGPVAEIDSPLAGLIASERWSTAAHSRRMRPLVQEGGWKQWRSLSRSRRFLRLLQGGCC